MPVINRIAGFADEMAGWRQHLHAHPELGLDCHETAGFVVERLRAFGVDHIEEGIATSGVMAMIEGQGDGPTIGLRADMDALPIVEASGLPYASKNKGKMHACGHDGHTTMLLGAAKYLAETRNFRGNVALIFQPAEEGPGGGKPMVEDGVIERYGIDQVYALHTLPGAEAGRFLTTPGPIMAAGDVFHIDIQGRGGHAAFPHETRDPVLAACGIAQAVQTITSRNACVRDDVVISITQIHTGTVDNVIPDTAYLNGTVRTFEKDVQSMVFERLQQIVAGQAATYDVQADLRIERGYPATVNDVQATEFAAQTARDVVGDSHVDLNYPAEMGCEDFSYFLNERPGAYLFLGQGDGAGLHHPEFNFNDDIAPIGASFFARLVERAQPLG